MAVTKYKPIMKRSQPLPDWAKLDLDAPDTVPVADDLRGAEAIREAVIMDVSKIFPTPPGEPGWRVAPRRKADHAKHLELVRQVQEACARGLGINGTGIWQPIVVRRTDDPNRFYITAGGRRWRAATEAGLTKIPVIVRDQANIDAFETALVENLLREDMTVADTAHALLSWMQEADLSIKEISKRTGKSESAISTAIGVVKDPILSKAVEDKKITPSQAREMLAVKGPPRLKLVDSVSARRAAGVSVPLPQLRQEVKAEKQAQITLRNSTGSTPITGTRQGTYTPHTPALDCSIALDRVIEALQAVASALPSQLAMGGGYYDRDIAPRLRQIDALSAQIKRIKKSEAAA